MQRNPVSPFYKKERCFAYVAEPALAMQRNAVLYHNSAPFMKTDGRDLRTGMLCLRCRASAGYAT